MQQNEYQDYHKNIKQLISSLNSLSGHEEIITKTGQILKEIKLADIKFIRLSDMQCVGHILLTRHGQCNNWNEKKFGFNPNSGLANNAMSAMQLTKKITKQLLHFPDSCTETWISPLVRAKQTAMLVLPEKIKTKINYDVCLTELSDYPSGNFLTSYKQMQKQYDQASLFSNPKKVITYKISSLLFGSQGTFERIQELSKQADNKLLAFSQTQIEFLNKDTKHNKKQQVNQTSKLKIQQAKKIISKYLTNNQKRDLWLFGHNKNLRTLLKQVLNDQSRFQFGEIRRVYVVRSEKNKDGSYYFCPSYNFVVNQQNGSINGKWQSVVPSFRKIV